MKEKQAMPEIEAAYDPRDNSLLLLHQATSADAPPSPPQQGADFTMVPEPDTQDEQADPAGIATPIDLAIDPHGRILANVSNAVVERYRRLRTKLVQQGVGKQIRSVMISSALQGEGKTLTTVNLAISFAMVPGCRVLVVDGDLRTGSLRERLGAPPVAGLGELIEGHATLAEVVRSSAQVPIHLIFAGNSTVPPAELIHPDRLRAHIEEMGRYFDVILVDSPPLNPVTDGQLLAGSCDAVLLVARAHMSRRAPFERAVHDLQGFRILGAVLNGGEENAEDHVYKGNHGAL